jgi:hypothetical protein
MKNGLQQVCSVGPMINMKKTSNLARVLFEIGSAENPMHLLYWRMRNRK